VSRIVFAVLVAAILAGCASGEKMVQANAAPQRTSGYVGGNFTLQRPTFAAAFVLTHAESGKEYVLPFTRKSNFAAGHNETSLVELPRGTYRATHWIVFNAYWGPGFAGREFKAALRPSKFTEAFRIEGGDVVFLGKFVTENQWTPGYFTSTTSGRWEAERISEREARGMLGDTYPTFSRMRFVCLTCSP
jgi:hypothetical protein